MTHNVFTLSALDNGGLPYGGVCSNYDAAPWVSSPSPSRALDSALSTRKSSVLFRTIPSISESTLFPSASRTLATRLAVLARKRLEFGGDVGRRRDDLLGFGDLFDQQRPLDPPCASVRNSARCSSSVFPTCVRYSSSAGRRSA